PCLCKKLGRASIGNDGGDRLSEIFVNRARNKGGEDGGGVTSIRLQSVVWSTPNCFRTNESSSLACLCRAMFSRMIQSTECTSASLSRASLIDTECWEVKLKSEDDSAARIELTFAWNASSRSFRLLAASSPTRDASPSLVSNGSSAASTHSARMFSVSLGTCLAASASGNGTDENSPSKQMRPRCLMDFTHRLMSSTRSANTNPCGMRILAASASMRISPASMVAVHRRRLRSSSHRSECGPAQSLGVLLAGILTQPVARSHDAVIALSLSTALRPSQRKCADCAGRAQIK
ncbi:unnamed protein product, partial [Mycena citricolor]